MRQNPERLHGMITPNLSPTSISVAHIVFRRQIRCAVHCCRQIERADHAQAASDALGPGVHADVALEERLEGDLA